MTLNTSQALALAKSTLQIEAAGLAAAQAKLGESFTRACELMLACTGRVVVTGMGKSGHVGNKIAATLASTGTPAFFMHPAEASHGDLGMIMQGDVLLALSNSGEVQELTALLPSIKRMAVPLIAITGGATSSLAKYADAVLDSSVAQEACPLNLAPTASTTVQLALGDALAVALLDARGFGAEDFARSHPGGSLGRKLLTTVQDIMRTGDALPQVRPDASLREVMLEMTAKGLGMTAITDDQHTLLGIFTDGDLRRVFDKQADTRTLKARDVMHAQPRSIRAQALATEAVALMEQHRISQLLVTDAQGKYVGAFNTVDLLRAKVI
jgi:arabinose-5-phosphate isomerase